LFDFRLEFAGLFRLHLRGVGGVLFLGAGFLLLSDSRFRRNVRRRFGIGDFLECVEGVACGGWGGAGVGVFVILGIEILGYFAESAEWVLGVFVDGGK